MFQKGFAQFANFGAPADGASIDDPAGFATDRLRVRQNRFLEAIYRDFYRRLLEEIPAPRFADVLEVGSGGGFLQEVAPRVTTSELVAVDGVDRVVDACKLGAAFGPDSLDAVTGLDVLHHLPDPRAFFRGCEQVLRAGGRVVLIDPWFSPVGQWFYRVLHHEPYLRDPSAWRLVGTGRLSGANSRMSTSIFGDSPDRFRGEFPQLRILKVEPFHKWLYLASGGLKLNTRVPAFLAQRLLTLDRATSALDRRFGIFARVVLERVG